MQRRRQRRGCPPNDTGQRRLSLFIATLLATCTVALTIGATPAARAVGPVACTAGRSAPELNGVFGNQLGEVAAFDSPTVLPLPDGRHLWLLQDVFLAPSAATVASLRPPTMFAHNAALVQDGNCFSVLHGPVTPGPHCSVADGSWIGHGSIATCSRWFWPMGAGIDADGAPAVFMGEYSNPVGSGAAPPAALVAVWLATLDPDTFEVTSLVPAPDPGGDIAFGHWVESDDSFSYLFGWSRDQFNLPDPTSPPPSRVFLARVMKGRFDMVPQYWNGATWTDDRAAAAPIADATGGRANAMQPRRFGPTWVSVVKLDEWSGGTVRVSVASKPQGPWTTTRELAVPTRTLDGVTNTYAAHLLPWQSSNGNLVVALSNNAWEMDPVAFASPALYRPTFFEVEAPPGLLRGPAPVTLSPPLGFIARATPTRAVDTRRVSRFAPGETRRLDLGALVEPGAAAVAVNLTAVQPSGSAYLTAWPCDRPQPGTSSVNAGANTIRAAHSIVSLATDRSICVFANTAVDVLVDVYGSYVPSATPGALGFHPATPARLYDSRVPSRRWVARETRRVPVPAASALTVNITAAEPATDGFVTVFPCAAQRPEVSNLNMQAGNTVANLVEVAVTGGEICVYSSVRTHLLIDLVGTFDGASGGLHYQPVEPTRLIDTRVGRGSVIGRVAFEPDRFGVLPANAPVALSGVPAGPDALVVSMIAAASPTPGWGVVAPCLEPGSAIPYRTSTVNFVADATVANLSVVPTPAFSGQPICTFSDVPAFHIIDLVGWFVP